jgi:chemotaxis protein MotA
MRLKALSRIKLGNKAVVLLSLTALVLVIIFSAYQPLNFLNLTGLLLVVAGTLAATLLSHSFQHLLAAFKQVRLATKPLDKEVANDANVILHFAQLWFRSQNALIDRDLAKLDKPFLKQGLQMVRDRQSSDEVLSAMNWQISQVNIKENSLISVFRSMANFAPAFGMAGSVLGLVNMLQILDQGDMTGAPTAMLVALLSTFYGLLFANLVFKPMASKLERRRIAKVQHLTLLAEGVLLIQEKRTPAVIRNTLMTYIQAMQPSAAAQTKQSKARKQPMLAKFGFQGS